MSDSVRREIDIRLVLKDSRLVPLGRTLVDASQALASALHDLGLTVESSNVKGRELA